VDTRNAPSRDHRKPGSSSSVPWRPVAPPPSRTVLVPAQPAQVAQAPIVYAQPLPQQSPLGNLFGKLTSGQVIEMVAQLFAALQPLPAAPVPTRNSDTDSGNMILFQDALAKHAKRDEQVRMVGSLVARLIG
jgi:hypothetical protein